MKAKRNSLKESLNELLKIAEGKPVSLRKILEILSGRGQAALLILFSLPFCQPIQIPGFSVPFGLALSFIGLRIAFGHRVLLPKKILDLEVPFATLKKIADIAIKITDKLKFLISTRLTALVKIPTLHLIHGLVIVILGLLLALPVPIPLTNLLAAYPILAFGLGLLEDDGVMILLAYCLSFLCFLVFAGLIWFGKESFKFFILNSSFP